MRFMKCLISINSFITACSHVVRPKKTCVRQTDALVRDYTSILNDIFKDIVIREGGVPRSEKKEKSEKGKKSQE
ncbi:Histone_H2A [Hexamita inflata]|uniref:Histone H2A n=1 Tax=Hexamita inflata TaxID=28002 RepID=A0AA86NV75_9EUKA|nr:Histone H2A [Hexamita inflata]